MSIRSVAVAVVALCGFALPALADEPAPADAAAPAPPVVTHHQATVGGQSLRYTATVSTTVLKNADGEPRGEMFSTAYTLDGVENPAARPITFVFNGGPGSASVWLHMGGLGPKRVVMSEQGEALPPPGAVASNPHSWLDLTDLVFIDPVGTGFSVPAGEAEQSDFSGVRQDAESVAEFIRLYVTNHNRWLSPKFLAGESYGTTRAAAVAGELMDEHHINLNGVFLVSMILDFGTARFTPGHNIPYVTFLPTYTATAWFHERLPDDLQKRDLDDVLAEVREWALSDYAVALSRGASLSDADRRRITEQLARYTGLSEEYIDSANQRVSIGRFTKELRRDERLVVGRLDSRYTGIERDAAGESFTNDPSFAAILGPYTAAIQSYFRADLGVEREERYEILNGGVRPWEWNLDGGTNSFVNVADTLRGVMLRNPHMLVHVAAGYYDLATPFFAAEYTMDQMLLPAGIRENIVFDYYRAGHMMYVRDTDLAKLKTDVARVFDRAMRQRGPAPVISTESLNR